jgi:hypothetical protein
MEERTGAFTLAEAQEALAHVSGHIDRFTVRYTDATKRHAEVIITLRPFDPIPDGGIDHTGWKAQRGMLLFALGVVAHFAMRIGDVPLWHCISQIVYAAIDRAEPPRGDA